MSKCSQRRVECLLFDEGEDGRVLDYFDSYTKVNSLTIFQVQVQFKVEVEVQGSGFRVQGSGFRIQGSEFRVQGSGFRIQVQIQIQIQIQI